MNQEPEPTILRYLLGELSEAEQAQFEDEYFADPPLFQRVQDARNDLMDSYVRDDLPAAQRARFEQYFLASPRRRERVELARALAREHAAPSLAAARAEQAQRLSFFGGFLFRPRLIFAAAMLLIVFGVMWFLRSQQQPAPTIANHTPVAPSATASLSPIASPPSFSPTPVSSPSPVSHQPVIATFTLSPILVRDNNETPLLTISTKTDVVQLRLEREGQSQGRYQARLRTPEGREIARARALATQTTAQGQWVVWPVAAKLLRPADYVVQLEGVTATGNTIDRYYFRVAKK